MAEIHVKAVWDVEAGVWVATSDDVPGLATWAETHEALVDKLRVMIPELLEANEVCAPEAGTEVLIDLHADRHFSAPIAG